jgi:hypothetical protein
MSRRAISSSRTSNNPNRGGNHARLAEVKKKYDPDGLFFVHHGVGSEQWTTRWLHQAVKYRAVEIVLEVGLTYETAG